MKNYKIKMEKKLIHYKYTIIIFLNIEEHSV